MKMLRNIKNKRINTFQNKLYLKNYNIIELICIKVFGQFQLQIREKSRIFTFEEIYAKLLHLVDLKISK